MFRKTWLRPSFIHYLMASAHMHAITWPLNEAFSNSTLSLGQIQSAISSSVLHLCTFHWFCRKLSTVAVTDFSLPINFSVTDMSLIEEISANNLSAFLPTAMPTSHPWSRMRAGPTMSPCSFTSRSLVYNDLRALKKIKNCEHGWSCWMVWCTTNILMVDCMVDENKH